MMSPSIYDYVKSEATNFETEEIQVGDNWYWNLRNHVQMIFHLKNGMFFSGENNWLRAFKNIMESILDLSFWTEDIEVKDIVFYIDGKDDRVSSFLLKKYHDEVYAKENDLDKMIDDITESDLEYGGALVQKGKDRPEVLQLNSIAFCDQTDLLGGPIGLRFFFAPSKLRQMAKMGWGDEKNGATISIEELITIATAEKDAGTKNTNKNQVTGKTIEVYIVRGDMPERYLKDNDEMDKYVSQIQIIGFYTDKDGKKQGVTLYRREADEDLKFFTSKEVYNRALGRGVGERLLQPQIWTNFLEIHKMNMLEAGSKVPLVTDDPSYTQKNKIQDMETLEITTIEDGKTIRQIPTIATANIQLYANSINEWYEQAQFVGSAFDPIMGKEAVSGTTFRGQERNVAQGRGIHDRRRGQRAKFVEEIYRWDIIPRMVKKIKKGKEFLATLTNEELTWISEQLATNKVNDRIKEVILKGEVVTKEQQDMMTQTFMELFAKKGNRHLLEIVGDEFKDIETRIGISVASKQKNLANLSDKLLSVFQFVFTNPQGFQQAMQIPAMAKAFDDIMEFSGLSPADFTSLTKAQTMPMQPEVNPQQPTPSPLAISNAQPV